MLPITAKFRANSHIREEYLQDLRSKAFFDSCVLFRAAPTYNVKRWHQEISLTRPPPPSSPPPGSWPLLHPASPRPPAQRASFPAAPPPSGDSTTCTSSPTFLSSKTSSPMDLLSPIHLHLCLLHLFPQLLQHLEVWPDTVQRQQPAALPGHLGLQAARLGRDCPGLLLQPIITSSALPFLANSLLHVGLGVAKKRKCQIFKTAKP